MALLLSAGALWGQGAASVVNVSAPESQIVSAAQMQLTALARDAQGTPRNGDRFNWTSSNANIVAVNPDGVAEGKALGHADITAALGNVRGTLRIQVLPLRIEVTPDGQEPAIGEQVQYAARALNQNGEEIAGVNFTWNVVNQSGNNQTGGLINAQGQFRGTVVGPYTIRALITYSAGIGFAAQYAGTAKVRVVASRDYAIAPLMYSDTVRESFRLRLRRGTIGVTDAGEVVFPGSLEGLNSGVLRWRAGQVEALAVAGTGGAIPNSVTYDFTDLAVTGRGTALARVAHSGAGSALWMYTADGPRWVHAPGANGSGAVGIDSAATTPYSVSETQDEFLFRATFRFAGNAATLTGLFRGGPAGLTLLVASNDSIPTMRSPVTIEDGFGIDAKGDLLYRVFDGARRAWMKRERATGQTRALLATGDALGGSTVRNVFTGSASMALAQSGQAVIAFDLADGRQALARFRPGAAQPDLLFISGFSSLHSSHADAGTTFYANAGAGGGLYLWKGDEVTALQLIGRPGPNGEPVRDIWWSGINARGEVYATLCGVQDPWMLARLSGGPRVVVLETGAAVNVAAPVNFMSLAAGDRTGGAHVQLGGTQWSLFEATADGLLPVLLTGDRFPGGTLFSGDFAPRKTPSGELVIPTGSGIFRLTNEGWRNWVRFPLPFAKEAVTGSSTNSIAVNDRGQALLVQGTNSNHTRMTLAGDATPVLLAAWGANAQYQTAMPGGGTLENWNEMALNDSGEALATLRVQGDIVPKLYLWRNGAWELLCAPGSCVLFGGPIAAIDQLRGAGDYFYARFTFQDQNRVIARWKSGEWRELFRTGDNSGAGSASNGISLMDGNRRGAAVFTADSSLMTADGDQTHAVHSTLYPLRDGTLLRTFSYADIRDDGRVYFAGLDFFDRWILYVAQPQ